MTRKKKTVVRTNHDPMSRFLSIKKALEDNRYRYRTLRGISKSAGVPIEEVSKEIAAHANEIVVLARKNQAGESLYTTRDYYKKTATMTEKLMGALTNRVY